MLLTKMIDQEEMLTLLETFSSSPFVAIDTETNGEDVRDGRGWALGISLAWQAGGELHAVYLPFKHLEGRNYEFEAFHEILQKILDTKPIVFHNAKFDLVSLTTLGLNTSRVNYFCTMLLGHLLNENLFNQGLDSSAKYHLGDPGKRMKGTALEIFIKKFGWGEVPSWLIYEYAAYDAHLTFRLFLEIWKKLQAEGTTGVWSHKSKFNRLVSSIESRGVRVDRDLCLSMSARGHSELTTIQRELGGLNPSSPIDLRFLLLDTLGLDVVATTPAGKPSFDKKAMEEYEIILESRQDQTARKVLEYRGWQKSVSSNYEAYVNLLSPDGRLRPNFKLHGTKTGRLSCEKPNLQQIPRSGVKPWNGKMKACFIPEEGYTLVEADYSQLEFRLGAVAAKEYGLIDIFNDESRDIFKEMAGELFPDPELDRALARDWTKTTVYSIQYGAGVRRLMNVFGLTYKQAEKRLNDYYSRYPGFRQYSDLAKHLAEANGRVQIWSGRYRHFAHSSESRKAFNSIIQGGAADIVERTMLRAHAAGLNSNECRMLLQVHDAILFEVRTDLLGPYLPEIRDSMEAITPEFGVKFPVDIHRWGSKDKLI